MDRSMIVKPKASAVKFLLAALVGGAVGATAGILFAPRSGKVTRSMIGEKYEEFSANIRKKFEKK